MDWAFFSKWLKLSFGFRKNRQQPKQGEKKICFANFGIFFAEKTWKRRIEGGIGEI